MATMTLADAQAALTTVNAAIDQLVQGKRITTLVVGSGAFQRRYEYQECTYENLKAYQQELLAIIDSYSPTTLPTFRTNATIPLVVRKGFLTYKEQ